MDSAELDNTAVLPVDKYRLFKALDQIGWRFESNKDYVILKFTEGTVLFSLEGNNNDVLRTFGHSKTDTEYSWPELLELANNWNTSRRWPTVAVEKVKDGAWVTAAASFDLEHGVTDRFLVALIESQVAAMMACYDQALTKVPSQSRPTDQ